MSSHPDVHAEVTTGDLLRDRRILLLLGCSVLGFGGFGLLVSALPLWAAQGGSSTALAGVSTTTATLAATVVTQFAVPAAVARVGVGPSLAVGLLALGAPAPLYALTADPLALATISVVRGIGFGLLTVIGSLLVALLAPRSAYGRTAGLYGMAVALPTLVAVPGAVYLAERWSFTGVFVLAAMPVVAAPAAWLLGPLGRRSADTPARSWQRDAARASLAPTVVLVVVTLTGGGLMTYLPIALSGGSALAPVSLLVVGAAAALSRWVVGGIADRRGAAGLLVPAVLVTAAGTLAVAAGLASADRGGAALVLAGALLAGTGYGAVQNLTLVLAFARVSDGGSATASTVWNAGYDTGTAAGAAAVGIVAAAGLGLPGAVALTAVPVLAVLPLVLRIRAG